MPATIVSLTTIPSRMDRIGPTLESLLRQRVPIDAVHFGVRALDRFLRLA